jgi:hypothetical protein
MGAKMTVLGVLANRIGQVSASLHQVTLVLSAGKHSEQWF